MKPSEIVQDSNLLIQALGYWPSFHDANVLKVSRDADSCTASIHVFKMTDKIDENRYFILEKHHVVDIQMLGVTSNTLPINHSGDVLASLDIARSGDVLQIDFNSHLDQDGTVLCKSVRVLNVTPYTPKSSCT